MKGKKVKVLRIGARRYRLSDVIGYAAISITGAVFVCWCMIQACGGLR